MSELLGRRRCGHGRPSHCHLVSPSCLKVFQPMSKSVCTPFKPRSSPWCQSIMFAARQQKQSVRIYLPRVLSYNLQTCKFPWSPCCTTASLPCCWQRRVLDDESYGLSLWECTYIDWGEARDRSSGRSKRMSIKRYKKDLDSDSKVDRSG